MNVLTENAGALSPRQVARRRMEYVERIDRLKALGGAAMPFVGQAQRMLMPRYWARANWNARAKILSMVDWYLRMGEAAHEMKLGEEIQGMTAVARASDQRKDRHFSGAKA